MTPDDLPAARLSPLTDRFGERITVSVDDFEVATVLEADGVDDKRALEYGSTDVFALARMLRRALPSAGRIASPPRPDWYPPEPVAVLRGAVFALGGLAAVTAVGLGGSSAAVVLVLAVNALALAVLQPVSFLGHLALERSGKVRDPAAIRPLLSVFGLPLAVFVGVAPVVGVATGLFVVAALASMIGMVAVLVLGRVVLVASAVLPVAAIALLDTIEPGRLPSWLIVGTWLLASAVLVVASFLLTRPHGRKQQFAIGSVDVRGSLPFAAAGLVTGVLVIANVLMIHDAEPLIAGSSQDWLVATLPFLLPITTAELLVVRTRRVLLHLTSLTRSPAEFHAIGVALCRSIWSTELVAGLAIVAVSVSILDGGIAQRTLLCLSFLLLAVFLTACLLLLAGQAVHAQVSVLGATTAALLVAWVLRPLYGEAHAVSVDVLVLALASLVAATLATRVASDPITYP